jgi:hypothetical protein
MTSPQNQQPSTVNRLKAYYRTNPWKGRFVLLIFSIAILFSIARLVLTPTIIHFTTSWLKDQGINATIEDIKINILSGSVSLINAEGYKDNQPLFNIGLIDIHWRWSPLSDKAVVVTKVALDNLKVNIDQYSDEMVIGGLVIPMNAGSDQAPEPEGETDEDVKPWSASLGKVVFTNLNVCYLQSPHTHATASKETNFVDYCVDLKEMTWGGTISYGTDPELINTDDIAISTTGDFKLDGLIVTNNKLNKYLLNASSNTLSNVSISGLNNIHIDKLTMNDLSALQRDDENHKDAVRFKQLSVNDISFSNLNSLTIDSVSLDNSGLFIVKLDETDWEYAKWIPETTESIDKTDGPGDKPVEQSKDTPQNKEDTEFNFAINNVQVSNSDFCYLEKSNKLYYCFTQKNLDWQGSTKVTTGASDLKLSVNGTLIAINTKIRNHEIKRDLVDIEKISLSKLDVASIDTVKFDSFTIDNLLALQRGDKVDDSTGAFSNLAINTVAYTGDTVTIDKIKLDSLSSHVSKNKDGSWEFDKWIVSDESKSGKASKVKAANDQTDKSENDKNKASKKPPATKDKSLTISINSIDIKTKKEILYIDNSTEPTMKIGLNELDFNIHDLNAKQPNTDSPFKLSAKTIRHSTIDLAGTVRPYAEKLSLDAKGKLKGFDLRAATPAAEQAIGHIIQSGQLDADLTLLAKDGILDSKIALSLYHFNIKAKSKKDAEKLDKKFGMPLNQTLTLLRDKDGSIHMDIPITGDVDSPDFDPMDAIIKATSKAATFTLITFYTPYGLAYYGGSAVFDLATALDFKPIIFKPGSAEMPDDSEEQLDTMAKLLTEKPQVHLSLCGVTNNQDIYALYPKLKDKSAKDDEKIKLNDEQNAALRKLAQDRQTNSKGYLIKHSKIEHDRLILCEPEHRSDKDAIAGVEINI